MIKLVPFLGALLLFAAAIAGAPSSPTSTSSASSSTASSPRGRPSLAPLPSGAVSTHDPFAGDDCAACHASADKHAPGPVKQTSSALCLECHDDPAPDVRHRHGGERGCVDCHNPHNSRAPKLLHAPVATLCSSCHSVGGVREHAPIAQEASCIGCHGPHGTNEQRLLTASLAPTLYAPYRRDSYGLCFGCHAPELVEAATTTTATRFRDGTRNLHTVHVMRDKGRTCRACHDAHAASGPALVPESVAFGSHGWRLPLSFRQTESGGSCAKTCHLERGYERGATPTKP